MNEEKQQYMTFHLTLYETEGSKKSLISQDKTEKFLKHIKRFQSDFEKQLIKDLGVKSICISPEVLECHVENEWDLNRLEISCGNGEATRIIRRVLENEYKTFSPSSQLGVDFKWEINEKCSSNVSETVTWFENQFAVVGHHPAPQQKASYADSVKKSAMSTINVTVKGDERSVWESKPRSGFKRGEKLEAVFWLIVPESYKEVEKVWLVICQNLKENDGIAMKSENSKVGLWVASSLVEKGQEYYYQIKYMKKPAVYEFWKSDTAVVEPELLKRKVLEHYIQKDIFGPPIEKKVVAIGYRFFLERIFQDMKTEDDLFNAIEDYEMKHKRIVAACDHHIMASLIVELYICTNSQNDHTRCQAAVFTLYLLSKMYPNSNSIFYGYPGMVTNDAQKMTLLLNGLKMGHSKQLEGDLAEGVADILVAILCKTFDRHKCSWLDLVLFSHHFLPSNCLIKKQQIFENKQHTSEYGKQVMSILLNRLDQNPGYEELIMELMKTEKTVDLKIDVLKALRRKNLPDSKLMSFSKNNVLTTVKETLKSWCGLNTINNLTCKIKEADESLLCQLNKEFEEAVLNHLGRKIDDHREITEIISLVCSDCFFTDREQAFKMMHKIVKVHFKETHSLFLRISKDKKFLQILNMDFDQTMSLFEEWLKTANKMKPSFGYDKEWYAYVQEASALADRLVHDQIKGPVESHIFEYFASAAKSHVSSLTAVQDIVGLGKLLEVRDPKLEKVLVTVCADLEACVLKLVKKTGWNKTQIHDTLVMVLHHPLLFTENVSSVKILEAVATSKDLDLHCLLPRVMCEKFWKLPLKELNNVFERWLKTAIASHCKEKVKSSRNSNDKVESAIVLYDYLLKFFALDIPSDYQDLKQNLEMIVKEEFESLKPGDQNELVDLISDRREDLSSMVMNHYEHVSNGTLSEQDIQVRLKRHGEADGIDVKSRTKFKAFKVFLESLNNHMKTFKSDVDREEFVFRHTSFWLKMLSYQGIHDDELKNHDAMCHMTCIATKFAEKTMNSSITLSEFKHFEDNVENVGTLIARLFGEDKFSDHWNGLRSGYDEALKKFHHVNTLYLCFLRKVKIAISDIDQIKDSLKRVKKNLDDNSCCPMGDFNKPGFFLSLSDFIEPAKTLFPLRNLTTFINLYKMCLKNIVSSKQSFTKSCSDLQESFLQEINLSLILEEGSNVPDESEIETADVVNCLENECVKQYKEWLQKISNEDATLSFTTKYGTEQISDEIKTACKHFEIPVAESTLVALQWLNSLTSHKQHAKRIQMILQILDLNESLIELDATIDSFFDCINNPDDVTINKLAHVMYELKEELSSNEDDWWDLIDELSKSTKLVHFIKGTLDDDFRNLIDAVEEQSEQTIDESTVSNLIKVKQFLQPLLRQKFEKSVEFFDAVKRSMQREGKDISAKINNCSHHLHGLIALYQHVANRGELTKEIINSAMTTGKYTWRLNKDDANCTVVLTYSKQSYRLEDLSDLRSRALLLSNSEKREKDQKAKQLKTDLQCFVRAVDIIQEITSTVTELNQLGHFSFRTYNRKLQSSKELLSNLTSFLDDLKQQLEEWKHSLDDSRQEHHSLNYVYSDQLSLLYNFLCGNKQEVAQIQNILKFVHPGATVDSLKKHELAESEKEVSDCQKLDFIGRVLDQVMHDTETKRILFPNDEKFQKQSKDVKAVVEYGILNIVHLDTTSTQTIPTLLSLYANTERHFPVPSEVLFCHELTSWEEIHLLLSRCTKANHSELHCVCNVERLPSNVQTLLVEELSKLLESGNLKYRLAVICRGAEHHSITDYFASYVNRVSGFDTATVQTCLQETMQNVCMVTSSVPGLGKTEYIKNLAANNNKRMKSVHISGPLSREILVKQLQNQKLTNCDMLHLDIGEVDDASFLDACLFEYIILGCLCSGTKVVCLPTSHVAIEVANTVQNKLRDSLVILSSFNREHLKWSDYQDFVVSNEVCSSIQIVCNYLKLYDEGTLDNKDVVLNGPLSVKSIEPDTCRMLLRKYFSSTADLSYSVAEIFVNVFGEQLKKLSNSQFFRVSHLKLMLGDKNPIDVRSKLVKALLDVAQEFACRSVQSCRSVQTATLLGGDVSHGNEEKITPKLTQAELLAKRVDGMLHWADSNHLLITFNGTDTQTVSALYRDLQNVPDHIKELFKSQLRKELPIFNNLSKQDLKHMLERIARSSSQKSKIIDADVAYALTPDNILKMILILLRIRANIPIVIMGETGCGKTSLIRYLAHTCDTKFEHFSIHAGISVDMITEAVHRDHDECIKNPTKQIWLFFDEINTCDHLGLLTEIICHHSCFGKALAKNLVFIAACNPYRLREEHQIMTAGLDGKVKTDSFSKLVYRVHPLPETMIDYVWDYGTLHKDDEQSYIKQMISIVFPDADPTWQLREKVIDVLVVSQQFVRNIEKCDWCVSLRDVYRCQMLMTQFLKMLREKMNHLLDENDTPVYYNSNDDAKIYICAIVLALAHCYQSRLATTQKRDEYWKECSKILLGNASRFRELREMVRYEQLDLLNRMVLPQGIAKNTALCENVFVILVCILNRIPVFLVGKPGCSKSLSVQLIKSNLRGKDSSDSYFQTLPNLYIVSYQGSESSTSDGILKVFNKANKYGEANKDHGVLPVVLLDEVGLAEASRFNPLKVLHGLLEPATGELPSVAVVGISNWALDAAKMNRAIYLSRPDMDFQELYDTGKSISGAHSPALEDILRVLAEAYYKYQQDQVIKNFHGLRDYYALIKYVSRLLTEQENDTSDTDLDEVQIVQRGLLRNFGGTEYGVSGIIKLFSSSLGAVPIQNWPIEEIILDNLEDKLARHLMLITSGDSSMGILIKCLNSLERKYVTIFGSKFDEDQTEDYSYRILSRIILCMEAGNVLILKDLDTIYGSLYDMLNQNYTIVGKKKNCRIALGPNSNPMCQVHDDFRCIVLVDMQRVDYSDPPFLNRFEKQILRFETIIADEQKKLIKELENWTNDFAKVTNMPFVKANAFIGLNQDTISSVVYQIGLHKKEGNDATFDTFIDSQNALLWLVPPDAILRSCFSDYSSKSLYKLKALQTQYFDRPIHRGLSYFLSAVLEAELKDLPPIFNKTAGTKIVVYTHSNIYVDLRKVMKQHEPLQVEKLGSFKSEKQLTKQIRQFFESHNKLLILQCEPREDGKHIPLAKFQLEELHQECANKSEKHICIVMHMERTTSSSASNFGYFSFLSGWQLVEIDSLEQETYPLTETLSMNLSEILKTEFCPIKHCIQKNLVWAFTCTSSSYGERSMAEFLQLVTQISESQEMLLCLAECILECIVKDEISLDSVDLCDPERWQVKVACDMRLLHSATSFTDALKQHLAQCVTVPLANLVYHLEKLSAWNSYFRSNETAETWSKMFKNHEIFKLDAIEIPQGPGSFKVSHKPLKLQCPFSQIFIDKLCKWEELFKQEILEAETAASGNEGLNPSEYLGLFEKYLSLFQDNMSFLANYEPLLSFEEEIINDICNCLSLGYALAEDERIEVALWLIKIKAFSHKEKSPEISITESLLCLWRNQPLLHALLQLISECHSIFPCSIKEVLLNTGGNKQLKENIKSSGSFEKFQLPGDSDMLISSKPIELLQDMEFDHSTQLSENSILLSSSSLAEENHDQEQNSFEPLKTEFFEEATENKVTDNETLVTENQMTSELNLSNDVQQDGKFASDFDISVHELGEGHATDMINDMNSSAEKNDQMNDITEDDNTVNDDESKEADEKTTEEKESEMPDCSEDKLPEVSELNTYSDNDSEKDQIESLSNEEALDLHPEERLVHLLCKLLLPSAKVLKNCGGFVGWHGRVCSMLSFCSSVSSYPVSFHALRIFNDLATVLFHCKLSGEKIGQSLLQLSEVIDVKNLESSLTSTELFETVMQLYDKLDFEGVSDVDFECFVCMYIGRLTDVNPETELFGYFLQKAARMELLDKNLSQIELLLHRVLMEEEATLEDSLFDLFKKTMENGSEEFLSSPQLVAIDEALQLVDLKKPQFLILCADVIQDRVMKNIDWQILDDVKSAAANLLVMLKTAVDVIGSSENGSMGFATSLAFVKEFLHHLTKMIAYDCKYQTFDEHSVLYQSVNALLNNDDCWNYLVRELKLNRSYDSVRKLISSMENFMPSLAKCSIPDDDLSLAFGYKILGKSVERNTKLEDSLLQLNLDDKLVIECLKHSNNEDQLLSLIESLLHVAFIPNSRRPLTDTEKQIGPWLKEKVSVHKLPNTFADALVQRITNLESFGTNLLRITPEMENGRIQQSMFLLHLISIAVVKTAQSSPGKDSLLTKCLEGSNLVFKWVHNEHSATSSSDSKASMDTQNCFIATCKCWSRVMFSNNCDSCPVCGSKWNSVGVHAEKFTTNNLLCSSSANFEIKVIASEIMRLFIDAMLLCSLGIGALDAEVIKTTCEISDCENLIQDSFEKRWSLLQESLQLDSEDFSLFLRNIVDNSSLFDGSFDFGNPETLQENLRKVEATFEAILQQPSIFLDVKLYQKGVSVIDPKIVQNFQEFPTDDLAKLPTAQTCLFRQSRKRTLVNMKAQYYLRNKENSHPVIDMFFKKSHHLHLLQHLMPLIKWSLLCHQIVNHRFTREDCRNLTLQKLIQSKPNMKDTLKHVYDKFTESWDELCKEENFAVLHTHDNSLPAQVQLEHAMVCESTESPLYKVMRALVTIQNKFLTEVLFIALSGKCPSLGFLTKNFSNMAAIKAVLLQNLKEDEIINCTFESAEADLVKYGQNNLIFGLGSQAAYNFVKIEMELANMLSLGKAYVVLNQTFPLVTYANEMFVACASVLREFKTIITQKTIGSSVKDGIKKKMENNRDFVNQMMRQIEILLCFAKKTGGSPDMTLRNYNQTWLKTLPGGFAEDNLIFEGEPLCLSHLVALYEFLENLQADAAVKSMNPEFKKPLTKAVEKELKDFVDTNHIEITSIQVAFKRFVMRHLINFEPEKMDLDTPLMNWMTEPSLWVSGVQENGELDINKEGGAQKTIKDEFPQMLNLEHTFQALACIDEMIKERANQHAKWYQVERTHVTGSAAATAARPQQGRQRTRVKIGKT